MLCVAGKMSKDIGMTIRKSVVVVFLPCSVFCDLFLLFFWWEKIMDYCGCIAAACIYVHT